MQWETAIPAVLAGEADALAGQAVCGPMEADAFGGFYARTARPLWAYLARVGGDAALADDLMQEAFVRFLTADAPQDGEVAARRYLFRIATNLLRDHWRRPRAEQLDEMPEEVFAAKGNGAEATLQLSPVLGRLKPRERQLLWLAYAEGYSHREIAEVTGLASASVRLLLFRARHRAARLLKEGGAA
jgi:RNA polymerase sigma-70 factor (ECF subfamily)